MHGVFDFNATPIRLPGCKILVLERREHQASWDYKGIEGFYIGPAMNHYCNYHCYIPSTRDTRDSDTISWIPHNFDVPTTSSNDCLKMILTNLDDAIRNPHPAGPSLQQGTEC